MSNTSATTSAVCEQISKETLVYEWKIPNHATVISSEVSISVAEREFQFPVNTYTWKVGYKRLAGVYFAPYLQLLSTVEKNEILCSNLVLMHKSTEQGDWKLFLQKKLEKQRDMSENRVYLTNNGWTLGNTFPINGSSTVCWKVQAELLVKSSPQKATEDFKLASVKSHQRNFAQLLSDTSLSDLRIICSDGVELAAHRTILYAQNPVFAAMLTADMKERNLGILQVDDVSGLTMKILLEYLYTGDLPKHWQEPENIVEMTYVSGKYQLTEFQVLLDNVLGTTDHGENNFKLLGLSNKLLLKKAERRLFKRVKEMLRTTDSTKELYQLLENFQI